MESDKDVCFPKIFLFLYREIVIYLSYACDTLLILEGYPGIKTEGHNVNNLRYAADTILILERYPGIKTEGHNVSSLRYAADTILILERYPGIKTEGHNVNSLRYAADTILILERYPGIKTEGHNVNSLIYSDKTLLIAEDNEDHQRLDIVEGKSGNKGWNRTAKIQKLWSLVKARNIHKLTS